MIPVVMTLLASLLHTRVWSWGNWLDFVLMSGAAAQASLLGLYAEALWGFVGSQVGLLFSVTILYRLASRRPSGSVAEEGRRVSSWRLRGARIALALLGACLVVPTLLLAWGLSRPLPPIENTPEGPNCYPDLVRFAASINAATIPDVSTAPAAVLQAYAQQQAATVVRLRPLLERPSCLLLDYSPAGGAELVSPAIQDFRTAASWLQACGRGETLAGRTSEAAVIYLDLVRLSGQVSRGGLVVHQLVGNAMEGKGSEELSAIRAELSVQQLRDVRRTLLEINARREPHALVRRRDDTWLWRVYGWSARLSMLLESPLPAWFTSTRPAPPDFGRPRRCRTPRTAGFAGDGFGAA